MEKHCPDCGKEISWNAARCHSCATRWWRKNPGKAPERDAPICVDCGKKTAGDGPHCRSCSQKEINRNPEHTAKAKEGMRRHYREHPEARIEKRESAIRFFQDPIVRAKHKAAINCLERREAKKREKQALWDNPEWRRRQLEIMNSPDNKERIGKGVALKWKDGEWRARQEATYRRLNYSERFSGGKNPNWNGGIGRKPYGPGFTKSLRNKIRARDGFFCQLCGQPQNGKRLDVHHVNYNKNDNRPENLIALCSKCHTDTGHYRDSWEKFFSIIPRNIAY